MPEPVIVPWAPAELMTTAAAGVKVALALIVKVPATLKFELAVTAAAVLDMVKFP